MKLATFRLGRGEPRVGVVDADAGRLLDLRAAAERSGWDASPFVSMLALMDAGGRGLDTARALADRYHDDEGLTHALDAIRLLAPVPEPRQMRDGMSFPLHIRQSMRGMQRIVAGADRAAIDDEALPPLPEVYGQLPIYYITNRLIVAGPDETVRWPRYSRLMDYELELGVFIGRAGTDIPVSKAGGHIFGFTIFNDFSARDQQAREMPGWLGPAKGKSFNGGNVLGPWIVTPDEIGDPYSLAMTARVNGETRSQGTSSGMLFSFEEMIAHMSQDETLHAGEFIGSGTVGNGCGLEQNRFLEHGDVVELEVERIGVLRNRVERQPHSGAAG